MRKLAWLVALGAQVAGAQSATVRGIAYDSLRNVALAGAFITVSGTNRSAVSDARGAFHIDSLPTGTFTFVMQHEALDSLGLPSVSRRVAVTDGANVAISVPSFAAIWRRACDGAPPRDSALVFGVVSDASGSRRVQDASIEVSWFDYSVDARNKVSQRQRVGRVRSDSTGAFALCGVPSSMAVQLRASTSRGRSGVLDLMPGPWRVMRRDLRIADDADSLRRGIVAGVVTRNASPFENARVVVAGLPEVRSDRNGKFVVRDVPTGTRQVEISAIGMSPAVTTVDVSAGDTAFVAQDLAKAVELPSVQVNAPTVRQRLISEFNERKRMGLGYVVDSTVFATHPTIASVIEQVPAAYVMTTKTSVDSVFLRGGSGRCTATLIIDGQQVNEHSELHLLAPTDIAGMEVYSSGITVPSDIQARIRRRGTCGVVVIWTKHHIVP